MVTRADVIRVVRSYVGTPFQHRGRVPGRGLDCAGVVICAARELGLVSPEFDVPPYGTAPDGDGMLDWCDRYMHRVAREQMQPGDVLVLIADRDPQHLGVLTPYERTPGALAIVHASNSLSIMPRRVIETRLLFSRGMQFRAAYALPGVR